MSEKAPAANGGIGFVGLLTLLFVVCKLFGVINWSWWVVFAPIWISWIFVLIISAIVFAIFDLKN